MPLSTHIRNYGDRNSEEVQDAARTFLEHPAKWNYRSEAIALSAVRTFRLSGQYQEAEDMLARFPSTDSTLVNATRLDNQGRVYHDTDRFAQAGSCYERGISLISGGDSEKIFSRLASLCNNHGYNLLSRTDGREDLHFAGLHLGDSQKLYEKLGEDGREGLAYVLIHLAELERTKGDLEKARESLDWALEIETELGNEIGKALAYQEMGRIFLAQGDMPPAHRHSTTARLLIEKHPVCKRIRADILLDLTKVLEKTEVNPRPFLIEAVNLYDSMQWPE